MADPNNPFDGTMLRIKTTYTFLEAVEYMKLRDRYPTNTQIEWVSVKTGKRVTIGYTN